MENQNVSEGFSDWEQIQSPLPVFPPANHENLPATNTHDDDQHLQEQEHTDSSISPLRNGDGPMRWKGLRFKVLQDEILRFAGNIKKYATCKIGSVSFAWSAFGVAGLILVYFLHKRFLIWWQRRMQEENILREKDKKINELLLQIAQMNEILLARRKVPVIRVK